MLTILVGVFPNVVANTAVVWCNTCINRGVVFGQTRAVGIDGYFRGKAIGWVGVAVFAVVGVSVFGGQLPAVFGEVRRHKLHLVVATLQVRELVEALGVSRRGLERCARAAAVGVEFEEVYHHVFHAGFTAVLDAVFVLVFPDVVADGAYWRRNQARIYGGVIFHNTRTGHVNRYPWTKAVGVRIAVFVVGGSVLFGQDAAIGEGLGDKPYSVIAAGQLVEEVLAVVVGGRCLDWTSRGIAVGVGFVEFYANALDAFFTVVLQAVLVGVFPDVIANATQADLDLHGSRSRSRTSWLQR